MKSSQCQSAFLLPVEYKYTQKICITANNAAFRLEKHDTCRYSLQVRNVNYPAVRVQYSTVGTVPGIGKELKTAGMQLLHAGHVYIERHPESIA
jgi:hypothetical protein